MVRTLIHLREQRKFKHPEDEASLALELNAMVAVDAERYYRAMFHAGEESWNIRDARYTDMANEGMVNVGQLLREAHGDDVFAIGFGTHRGTVVAGREWGAPLQVMEVPRGQSGSWEDLVHQAGPHNQLMVFGPEEGPLGQVLGHRAIGVVYDRRYEALNYVPTVISKRYDAFIHVDETSALTPLALTAARIGE